MKNKILLFIVFLLSTTFTFAQSPDIEWQNTIGGYETDWGRSIRQTRDGGYIIGGESNSYMYGDKSENTRGKDDIWVIKIDIIGNIEWQVTLGGSENEIFSSVEQTTDDGYIVGGSSRSGINGDKTVDGKGGNDYWVIKLNNSGEIQWQKGFGGDYQDWLSSVEQTTDGGYILGGSSMSGISGDKDEEIFNAEYNGDIWIIKIDSSGDIIWQNTIGGIYNDNLDSIIQTSDGGYIIGGRSNSRISSDKTEDSKGEYDFWIIKLNATGDIEWQKTIGGDKHEWLYSIQQTNDGGYIFGGHSASDISGDKSENSNGWDYWVVKTDDIGNIEWQNSIDRAGEDYLYAIIVTNDGGYLVGGTSYLYGGGGYDYWIVKLDIYGKVLWEKIIGGDSTDDLRDIQQTTDNGFILAGYSQSGISGDKTEDNQGGTGMDYWIVKLGPDLNLTTELNFECGKSFILNNTYPNPFNPNTTISYNLDKDSDVLVNIYDISGKLITTLQSEYQTQGWHSISWNGTNYSGNKVGGGVYFYQVKAGDVVKTKKMILLK